MRTRTRVGSVAANEESRVALHDRLRRQLIRLPCTRRQQRANRAQKRAAHT